MIFLAQYGAMSDNAQNLRDIVVLESSQVGDLTGIMSSSFIVKLDLNSPPSPSLPPSSLPALPPKRWLVNDNNWFDRILCRLVDAERHEPELRFRDDYRIARLTVANCQVDLEQPWEVAFAFYLGKHPDKLIPYFLERARAHEAMEPKEPLWDYLGTVESNAKQWSGESVHKAESTAIPPDALKTPSVSLTGKVIASLTPKRKSGQESQPEVPTKFAESLPTPPVLSTLARVDGDPAIQQATNENRENPEGLRSHRSGRENREQSTESTANGEAAGLENRSIRKDGGSIPLLSAKFEQTLSQVSAERPVTADVGFTPEARNDAKSAELVSGIGLSAPCSAGIPSCQNASGGTHAETGAPLGDRPAPPRDGNQRQSQKERDCTVSTQSDPLAIQVSDRATQGSRPVQKAGAVRAGLAPRNLKESA